MSPAYALRARLVYGLNKGSHTLKFPSLNKRTVFLQAEVKLGVMLQQRQEMEMEERRKEEEDEGGSGRRRRRKVPDTLGSLEGLERGMRDDGEFGDDDGLDEGGGGGGGGGRISMESSVLTSRIVAQK